jgi:hypothetical protein
MGKRTSRATGNRPELGSVASAVSRATPAVWAHGRARPEALDPRPARQSGDDDRSDATRERDPYRDEGGEG